MILNGLLYLAGPIGGLSYEECTSWRDYVTDALEEDGIRCLSPLRHKHYLKDEKVLGTTKLTSSDDHPLSKPKAVLCRDRWDCLRSDVILVNLLGAKTTSIGTVLEIAWANQQRVPIVMVMEDEGNPHEHALLREIADFQVNNLDCAIDIVRGLIN